MTFKWYASISGFRLATLFVSMYNGTRMAFETGLIQEDLADFSPLLKTELERRPIKMPPYPQDSEDSMQSPIHVTESLLNDVLAVTKVALKDHSYSTTSTHVSDIDQLTDILSASKKYGTHATISLKSGLVPIINLGNIPDESLALFLSVFVDLPTDKCLTRSEILKHLSQFVPYTCIKQHPTKLSNPRNCGACRQKFGVFHWAHFTCCNCRMYFCINCPVKLVIMPRFANEPKHLCSKCFNCFNQQDIEDWANKSVKFIEIGTLESIKAALGCLTIALCLSNFSSKPVFKVVQALIQHEMPELAIPFAAVLLEHCVDHKETLRVYILCAQIFKKLANQASHSSETKWNLLLAAKECINLALETATYLDSSVEIPSNVVSAIQKEIVDSLNLFREKQELVQECEINMICSQMEACWHKRD